MMYYNTTRIAYIYLYTCIITVLYILTFCCCDLQHLQCRSLKSSTMTTPSDKLWQAVRVRGWGEVGGNNWQVQASRILITNASKSKPQQLRHFFIILSADDNFQSVCAAFPPLHLPLAARCRCHTNCRNTKSCSTHRDTQRETEGCWAALRTRKEKQKQKNIKKKKVKKTQTEKGAAWKWENLYSFYFRWATVKLE